MNDNQVLDQMLLLQYLLVLKAQYTIGNLETHKWSQFYLKKFSLRYYRFSKINEIFPQKCFWKVE